LLEDAERSSGDAVESISAEALLRTAMDKLQQMREERVQQQEQLVTALRVRDEELQRLQEHRQISSSINGDVCNAVRNADGLSGDRIALNFDELRANSRERNTW